ncbi:MAG: hypothetical protein IPK14_27890 [Blastocatellia bacterium]|nr:hypothetical protein [Blastocatellia bacterium]
MSQNLSNINLWLLLWPNQKRKKLFYFLSSFERLSINKNNITTVDESRVTAKRQGFLLIWSVPFSQATTFILTELILNKPMIPLWCAITLVAHIMVRLNLWRLIGETNTEAKAREMQLLLINTYINAGLASSKNKTSTTE